MLPDFPQLKRQFKEAVVRYVHQRAQDHGSAVADIPSHRLFEGNRNLIARHDGSVEEFDSFEGHHEFSIPIDEFKTMGLPELLEKLDRLAQELSNDKMSKIFTSLTASAIAHGQNVDAGGKPFSAELYLELLRSVRIRFDENGQPALPTLFASNDKRPEVEISIATLLGDPQVAQEFDTILRQKKEEWRAEQADRKLVG